MLNENQDLGNLLLLFPKKMEPILQLGLIETQNEIIERSPSEPVLYVKEKILLRWYNFPTNPETNKSLCCKKLTINNLNKIVYQNLVMQIKWYQLEEQLYALIHQR